MEPIAIWKETLIDIQLHLNGKCSSSPAAFNKLTRLVNWDNWGGYSLLHFIGYTYLLSYTYLLVPTNSNLTLFLCLCLFSIIDILEKGEGNYIQNPYLNSIEIPIDVPFSERTALIISILFLWYIENEVLNNFPLNNLTDTTELACKKYSIQHHHTSIDMINII